MIAEPLQVSSFAASVFAVVEGLGCHRLFTPQYAHLLGQISHLPAQLVQIISTLAGLDAIIPPPPTTALLSFLGEFTILLTGQTFSTSSPSQSRQRGRIDLDLAQPRRPILLFEDPRGPVVNPAISSLASEVMMANERVTSTSGQLYPSQYRGNAIG